MFTFIPQKRSPKTIQNNEIEPHTKPVYYIRYMNSLIYVY